MDIYDSWTIDLATVWLKVSLDTTVQKTGRKTQTYGWMPMLLDSVEPALQLAS